MILWIKTVRGSVILLGMMLLLIIAPQSYAGQVNAFVYHRFDESRYPSTNISADIFSLQLDYVKQQKIEVISLGEIATRLTEGIALPGHAIAFSVDDAYRSFYDVGMPIIRRYGFPVTLFVNSDSVGTSGYLNWNELKQLAAEGVEIGNHTANHAYLVELQSGETFQQWQKRIGDDIEKAQQQFIKNLGLKPAIFAYPYGEYSADVIEVIKNHGFTAAFAQQSGVIYAGQNRYVLPRFPMGGPFATLSGFKDKLAMHPILVTEEDSHDPMMRENPPVLQLRIPGAQIDTRRFNCFVQGDNRCWVEADAINKPGWYRVTAEQPLTGRRNKYTLTLQTDQGDWLWYSHLWVNAANPVKNDQ